jgi:hypothetical protein
MEQLFRYTVYAFVVISFALVAVVAWSFTHGG